MKARSGMVAAVVAGGLALTACGVSTTYTTSGLQDDTKHITAKYKTKTRQVTDYQRQCQTKWKTVTKSSGIGKNKRTSTERQSYQDCKNIRIGSHPEQYKVKVRSEKFCVELDRVKNDDDKYENDVWFTVSRSVYLDAVKRNEGDKVKKLEYSTRGC